jgi:hypothetical protein
MGYSQREKVFFVPPEIGRVKRSLSLLLKHRGGFYGRRRMTSLKIFCMTMWI